MPRHRATPEAAPVNPHWKEFFVRIRRAAERLDALEREDAAAEQGRQKR